MDLLSLFHQTNIIVHISAGSIALAVGLVAILTPKGGKKHRKSGRLFLMALGVVILTGLVGVLVFGRNTFLLVITLLSAYMGFSGFRVLKHRSNAMYFADWAIAIVCLSATAFFLYYFKSIGMIWSPVIIYSTVGYLLMMICYDFLKGFIPAKRYGNMWRYEHILKMMSAFSGILSAFTGTVLSDYQPYSQFLPSVLGTAVAIGFIVFEYWKANRTTSAI